MSFIYKSLDGFWGELPIAFEGKEEFSYIHLNILLIQSEKTLPSNKLREVTNWIFFKGFRKLDQGGITVCYQTIFTKNWKKKI